MWDTDWPRALLCREKGSSGSCALTKALSAVYPQRPADVYSALRKEKALALRELYRKVAHLCDTLASVISVRLRRPLLSVRHRRRYCLDMYFPDKTNYASLQPADPTEGMPHKLAPSASRISPLPTGNVFHGRIARIPPCFNRRPFDGLDTFRLAVSAAKRFLYRRDVISPHNLIFIPIGS